MKSIDKLLARAQGLQKPEEDFKCFRPWIEYNEKTGFTVTVYWAGDFLELILKTLTIDEQESKDYIESHIAGRKVFESADGIKEYIEGIVKGRKPCFISGEYDKPENAEKLREVLRATGYGIL